MSVPKEPPPRLLLVDDNRDILEMLTVLLGEKYSVAGYESATEALAALSETRPDLFMLDIGMSPIDGVQCLEELRAMPGFHRIPAIALTAFARETDRQEFLASGFEAVVTKPILDLRDLEMVIDRLLEASAARSVLTGASDNDRMRGHGGGH